MADRKYYCICDNGCKFETLTKEQILTAIEQAVNGGTIKDVDAGFVTTIKTISGAPLKFFVGAQSEYESLGESQKRNLFAVITNDANKEALFDAIESVRSEFDAYAKGIAEGRIVIPRATTAVNATNCVNASNAETAERATKDGNGKTIVETYGNFKNAFTEGETKVFTLASTGYYHIKALLAEEGLIDFGIVQYDGSGNAAYVPRFGEGELTYHAIEISAGGVVTYKRKLSAGSEYMPQATIRARKIV